MTTFYAILVGGTIHGKGGPSTAAVDGPAGPVTAADHIWRDSISIIDLIEIRNLQIINRYLIQNK